MPFGGQKAPNNNGNTARAVHISARGLEDWKQPQVTSEFNAQYGVTSSEKNPWGATHYAHIQPTGNVDASGEREVTVQAVPHGTPLAPGAYGMTFGSSKAPGYYGN